MSALRNRERRFLIVAGGIAAIILGYAYGVEPLVARYRQVQELITARQQMLTRQQRLLARRDRYQQEKVALEAEIAERRARLLPGDKPPLAASELQKLVKSVAQESGVEVRSERILPPGERGGYTEVPVEVTLSGPIRAVASLLYRLEAVPVLLAVTDAKLRVVSVGAPRELSVTLSLTGYIASGPSTGAPPNQPEPPRRPGA